MKKFLAFMSCLAIAVSMTACGSKSTDSDKEPNTEATTATTTESTTEDTTEEVTNEINEKLKPEDIINTFKLGDSYSLMMSNGESDLGISKLNDEEYYILMSFAIEDDSCMAVYQRNNDKIYLSVQSNTEENYFVADSDDTDVITDLIGLDLSNLSLEYIETSGEKYVVSVTLDDETFDGEVTITDGDVKSISFNDTNSSTEIMVNEYEPIEPVDRDYTEVTTDEINDSFTGVFFTFALSSAETSSNKPTDETNDTEIDDSNAETINDLEVSGYQNWGNEVSANVYVKDGEMTKLVTYTFADKNDGEDYISWWDNKEDGKNLYISVKVVDNGEDWYKVTEVLDHYYK